MSRNYLEREFETLDSLITEVSEYSTRSRSINNNIQNIPTRENDNTNQYQKNNKKVASQSMISPSHHHSSHKSHKRDKAQSTAPAPAGLPADIFQGKDGKLNGEDVFRWMVETVSKMQQEKTLDNIPPRPAEEEKEKEKPKPTPSNLFRIPSPNPKAQAVAKSRSGDNLKPPHMLNKLSDSTKAYNHNNRATIDAVNFHKAAPPIPIPDLPKQSLMKSRIQNMQKNKLKDSIIITIEGNLTMWDEKKSKWKLRWFELINNKLTIYKKKKGRKVATAKLEQNVHYKEFAEDETLFQFKFNGANLLVYAITKKEKDTWKAEILRQTTPLTSRGPLKSAIKSGSEMNMSMNGDSLKKSVRFDN